MRLPYLILVAVLAFNILVDWLLSRGLDCKSQICRRFWIVQSVLLNLVFAAVLLWPVRNVGNDGLLVAMWLLYVYITAYVSKYIFLLGCVVSRLIRMVGFDKLSKTFVFCAGIISAAVFVVLWAGAFVTRFQIDVQQRTVSSKQVPDGFNGFKMVHISDFHLGSFDKDTSFVSNVVNDINALHPDIIVFSGDLVNRNTTELKPFVTTLMRLKAPYGIYSVLGNHDYGDYQDWSDSLAKRNNLVQMRQMQKLMGWHLLDNTNRVIEKDGDSLWIVGVENIGDPPFRVYGDLNAAYGDASDSRPKILITHSPAHWESRVQNWRSKNFFLTLSGHTHAMQFEVAGWSPISLRYKHWGGLYADTLGRYINVNRGLGTVGFPARIGAKPEITVITLNNDDRKKR